MFRINVKHNREGSCVSRGSGIDMLREPNVGLQHEPF